MRSTYTAGQVMPRSEFEAKHELNLPGQAGAGIRGSGVVIIVVEIVGRGDLTEHVDWLEYPLVGYRVHLAVCRLLIIEGKIVSARITELSVIKNVEHLYTEFYGNTLT